MILSTLKDFETLNADTKERILNICNKNVVISRYIFRHSSSMVKLQLILNLQKAYWRRKGIHSQKLFVFERNTLRTWKSLLVMSIMGL